MQSDSAHAKRYPDRVTNHFFLGEHPQKNSYCIKQYHDNTFFVPNFIGQSLPRHDVGDREYYCAVMLMLFKPWRTGRDLREKDESWASAFDLYNFSPADKKIMANFNLRYECLDERDDYAAQRKKMTNIPFASDDVDLSYHAVNMESFQPRYGDNDEHSAFDNFDPSFLGGHGQKRKYQMQCMKHTLNTIGWNMSNKNLSEDIQLPALPKNYPKEHWKKLLESAQKQVLSSSILPQNPSHSDLRVDVRSPFAVEVNAVKIVSDKYFSKKFRDQLTDYTKLKNDLVSKYCLNKEQDRAFRLITNHYTSMDPDQLMMYLGGMAGTGKSQVIRSVTDFFSTLKVRHKLALLAPTGAAASLIHGSTYHSFLGINDREKLSQRKFASLKTKTDEVQYVILDEVSMLGLRDLYKISAQLAKLKNNTNVPFGGVNFIFAGDFAQLPPAMKSSALYASVAKRNANNRNDQETCIAKGLWHQITSVVILRKNMRQKNQSPTDNQLRTCLENMRYKACTDEDIAYLKSRQLNNTNFPSINVFENPLVRNVPIITAWNAHRDQINDTGLARFAQDTHQTLHHFFSIDSLSTNASVRKLSKYHSANDLSNDMQNMIWALPPAATDHVPGVISLCYNMPVMIKYNQATECCITNGAEATVVDWISSTNYTKPDVTVLDTVFVRLTNPPQTITLDGLPKNVVPITPEKKHVTCSLANDKKITLNRIQIPLLPNFAMTDYASQGRTRDVNVVHLTNCRTHQSYYTCLSHSSRSDTTFIVDDFNPDLITGGLSGWLRQEFRDLEILDDITTLKFENRLPAHITGHRRNVLIFQYRLWKGVNFVPPNVHPSVVWTESDFVCDDNTALPSWKLLGHENQKNEKTCSKTISDNISEPTRDGIQWLTGRNTCAYDALFTILWNVFLDDNLLINRLDLNPVLHLMNLSFHEKLSQPCNLSLDDIRERLRHLLYTINQREFSLTGRNGVDIDTLCEVVFDSVDPPNKIRACCPNCHRQTSKPAFLNPIIRLPMNSNLVSIQQQLDLACKRESTKSCNSCKTKMINTITYTSPPRILLIRRDDLLTPLSVNRSLTVTCTATTARLNLTGVIYHGDFHFTASFVDSHGRPWYHDGIQTKNKCVPIQIDSYDDLLQAQERNAVMFVYTAA